MQPHADGRVYHCGFCGTKAQVAIGADQVAAGLALDRTNIETFLGHLARSLQEAVPQEVQVQASGAQIHGIEVTLGGDAFVLRRDAGRVVSQYKKLVRGVALKTKDLPLEEWVTMLADSLARHANSNAQAGALAARLGAGR
jgi:hypothetical protein